MISAQQLDALDPQTRQVVQSLLAQVQLRDAEIAFKFLDRLVPAAVDDYAISRHGKRNAPQVLAPVSAGTFPLGRYVICSSSLSDTSGHLRDGLKIS